jgi:hypothetical protein
LQLLRARRGRKAAVAAIAPHVEASRYRLNGVPDDTWLQPYMVGFLGTLITLVAIRAVGPLRSHALGLLQMEAWAEITGQRAELVGQEICLLSAVQNPEFVEGCRSASAFLEARGGDEEQADADVTALWSALFDRRISPAEPFSMSIANMFDR